LKYIKQSQVKSRAKCCTRRIGGGNPDPSKQTISQVQVRQPEDNINETATSSSASKPEILLVRNDGQKLKPGLHLLVA
jgi:hypothetical protein